MSYSCVVGGCLQKEDQVLRCYLNQGGLIREEHASLDLCWFHREFFSTKIVKTWQYGWDPIKEKT